MSSRRVFDPIRFGHQSFSPASCLLLTFFDLELNLKFVNRQNIKRRPVEPATAPIARIVSPAKYSDVKTGASETKSLVDCSTQLN